MQLLLSNRRVSLHNNYTITHTVTHTVTHTHIHTHTHTHTSVPRSECAICFIGLLATRTFTSWWLIIIMTGMSNCLSLPALTASYTDGGDRSCVGL